MGVDIHFFVETERNGFWCLDAEFFPYASYELMALISPNGIRSYPTAGISKEGFPEGVSRKIVGKWGTWDMVKSGYPAVEPFKDKHIGTVYPYMGVFGEGWMTADDFENILALYDSYAEDYGYYAVYEYMRILEDKGISCRAVFFFDN